MTSRLVAVCDHCRLCSAKLRALSSVVGRASDGLNCTEVAPRQAGAKTSGTASIGRRARPQPTLLAVAAAGSNDGGALSSNDIHAIGLADLYPRDRAPGATVAPRASPVRHPRQLIPRTQQCLVRFRLRRTRVRAHKPGSRCGARWRHGARRVRAWISPSCAKSTSEGADRTCPMCPRTGFGLAPAATPRASN